MNIFQAMKLVGHFPVTQGFWKNIMVIIGLVGPAILLFLVFVGGITNWVTMSLLFVSIVVGGLGLYMPIEYVYCCRDAKNDIDLFFLNEINKDKESEWLEMALAHMTKGTTPQHHNVSCHECWDYYMAMKQKQCRG